MKRIFMLFTLIVVVSTPLYSFAMNGVSYCISLQKTFLTDSIVSQNKIVKLNIYITQEGVIDRQAIINNFIGMQNEIFFVLKDNGWHLTNRCLFADVEEPLDMVVGYGMNIHFKKTLRIKSYISSGRMLKYRGECLSQYFEKVLEKEERCLRRKYGLR